MLSFVRPAQLIVLIALAGCGDASSGQDAGSQSGAGGDGATGSGEGGSSSDGAGGGLGLGTGGSGGAASDMCAPGTTEECYPGDAGQIGVGACKAGTRTCDASGEFASWGECEGFVVPAEDVCGNDIDDDCDGTVDQGCCVPMDYTLTTGFTANGGMVCCEEPDTLIAVTDCGDGGDHWAVASGNCGVAYEGSENYGGPCASIQCKDVCP